MNLERIALERPITILRDEGLWVYQHRQISLIDFGTFN